MLQPLTNSNVRSQAQIQIASIIASHVEWFCTFGRTGAQALHRDEISIEILQDRLVLTCWSDRGIRSWRILGWSWNEKVLLLQASKRLGAELPLIEMIPRASASAIAATIRAARQLRCERLAQLAADLMPDTKVQRASLSPGIRRGQPGKYARIILTRKSERVAVTAPMITEPGPSIDSFLASALLWFKRTAERTRQPSLRQLWLIVSERLLTVTLNRVSLLRKNLRASLKVMIVDDDLMMLSEFPCPERDALWKRKLSRFPPVPPATVTKKISELVNLAPEAIDVVHARHGETLRYLGLPFARVRSLMNIERVWFGIESTHRRALDMTTMSQFDQLVLDLRQHRCASPVDRRHAFYQQATEAWLESLLRRDITKLDPGLIVAPLHAQFRTARGGKLGVRPIDILALRLDGRLVVIELKVTQDREHIFQGVDYWRRVEAHRRRGHIANAKLFGDKIIRDQPPLVYLVAPTLRVHPSFHTLAQCVTRDIEIYRFDINEDWRAGVRVMRRSRAN